MAWLAGRLRTDPRHPDTPALLLAAFAARFPVAYRLQDAAVEAGEEPFDNPDLADLDGWRCPGFLAVLAAHTAAELRLWAADRFPPATTTTP
ncbi:hypothetical protein AB0L25_10000 [Spirillospora sp. NPDC052242]